jgi:hypothetical protein
MKNIKLCMTMTLIVIAPTIQLFAADINTSSVASAQTAVVNLSSSTIPSSQPMGLSSEITAPRSTLSIDDPTVATPSVPMPVENATLLAVTPLVETPAVVVANVTPSTTPQPDQTVAIAPVESVIPVAVEPIPVSKAPAAPTVPACQENCWWNNIQTNVKSGMTAFYVIACNGITSIKNMI